MSRKNVLATDLDGTLIPLANHEANLVDLKLLARSIRENSVPLVFVTGRHLESVQSAIVEFQLPVPDWIICDVGATICQRSGADWKVVSEYETVMRRRLKSASLRAFHSHFAQSEILRLQEPVKQSDFKMSFYVVAEKLDAASQLLENELAAQEINGSIVASVDPFNGDGLLDVLPSNVSKAFALDWCCNHQGWAQNEIVFAGDSGNDFAALTAGYRSIIVGNANPNLMESVREFHRTNDWVDRLHIAEQAATSGVVEGCKRFGLF